VSSYSHCINIVQSSSFTEVKFNDYQSRRRLALQQNLRAYYNGLVSRNIAPGKIPADKIIPVAVSVKKIRPEGKDRETFTGTIRMLDYMAQRPMILNASIHVKEAGLPGKTVVVVEVSPQAFGHSPWQQLDEIQQGYTF